MHVVSMIIVKGQNSLILICSRMKELTFGGGGGGGGGGGLGPVFQGWRGHCLFIRKPLHILFFSRGRCPESWPLSPLWIRAWTKSVASTWRNTTAWLLMPSEEGHPNWCLFEKISMNDASTKFLSLIWQSGASRNWLIPNGLLEKFSLKWRVLIQMTPVKASCFILTPHKQVSVLENDTYVSFTPGKLAFQPKTRRKTPVWRIFRTGLLTSCYIKLSIYAQNQKKKKINEKKNDTKIKDWNVPRFIPTSFEW